MADNFMPDADQAAQLVLGGQLDPQHFTAITGQTLPEPVAKQLVATGKMTQDQYNKEYPSDVVRDAPQTSDYQVLNGQAPATPAAPAAPAASPMDQAESNRLDVAPPTAAAAQSAPAAGGSASFTPSAAGQPNSGLQLGLGVSGESTQTTEGYHPSAQAQGLFNQSQKNQIEAQKAQNQVDIVKANILGEGDRQVAKARDEGYADEVQRRQAESDEMTRQRSSINDAISKFQSMRVDPNQWYADQGTGGRITAGIAIALGSFGGGPNHALDIINKAIDRDIDAQKFNIDKAGKAVDMQGNAFQQLRQQIGDDNQSRSVLRDMYLQKVQGDIQGMLGSLRGPQAQANGQAALGLLQQQRADERMKLEQAMQSKSITTVSKSLLPMQNGQPVYYKPELSVPLPGGGSGMAPSAGAAEELRKTTATYQTMKENVTKLQQLYQKNGSSVFSGGAEATDAKRLASDIRLQYAKLHNIPRFTELENDLVANNILSENPTSILNILKTPTQLTGLHDSLDTFMQNEYKANGISWQSRGNKIKQAANLAPNQRH